MELRIKDAGELEEYPHFDWHFNMACNGSIYLTCKDGESWGSSNLYTGESDIFPYLDKRVRAAFLATAAIKAEYAMRAKKAVEAVIKANMAKILARGINLTARTMTERIRQYVLISSVSAVFDNALPFDVTGYIGQNEKDFNRALFSSLLTGTAIKAGCGHIPAGGGGICLHDGAATITAEIIY